MEQARSRSLIFERWPRYASRRPWTVMLGVLLVIVTLVIGQWVLQR